MKLCDVNLTNMAEEAINALSLIMANYFIYENMTNVKVQFFPKFKCSDVIDFNKPVVMDKKVAFNNMMAIISHPRVWEVCVAQCQYTYQECLRL